MPGCVAGSIVAYALSKRAALSWAALGLSVACQLSSGLILAAETTRGARLLGVPAGFAVALAASLCLTVGMFSVRTARNFRILLAPRAVVLGVLLALPREARGLELLLTLPLVFEVSIAEHFPANLAAGAAAILVSGGCAWLAVTGLPGGPAAWNAGFLQADWVAVSVLFGISSSLLLYYREQSLEREQERRRLDAAVGELARANLGYQEFAAVLEQRTMVEERRRITRDIHDVIGYTLTNNIMMMEAAVEMVRRDPQRVSALITEARRNAEEGLDGIRNALHLLRAQENPAVAGMDLIEKLVSTFRAATGVEVRLEYGNARGRIDREVEGVLFHVIQEALTNSFRHGRATRVEILFWCRDDGTLVVNVSDNGGGALDIHEGIGLSGMRERVVGVGGTLKLRMSPIGFTVTVEVPPGAASPPGATAKRATS